MNQKPRAVFNFVEAGMGHIVPMTAAANAFERKYGDRVDVVRTRFFQDGKNEQLEKFEKMMIYDVKKCNKHPSAGKFEFFMMDVLGKNRALKISFSTWYRKVKNLSMEYMADLHPDIMLHTHFSTGHFQMEARERGLTDAFCVTYSPDSMTHGFWDNRNDLFLCSRQKAIDEAIAVRGFDPDKIRLVPFLFREEIASFDKTKEEYKAEMGFPVYKPCVVLADGAYGKGRIERYAEELMKSDVPMTIVVMTGKNRELFDKLNKRIPFTKPNITLIPFEFTTKMLNICAAMDVFVGKGGASSLAEACYFGAPVLVNFFATPLEHSIGEHYAHELGCGEFALRAETCRKYVEKWFSNPERMKPYIARTRVLHRADGAEKVADAMFEKLCERYPDLQR